MEKQRIKKLLDFIPYLILVIYAFILVLDIATSNFVLTWRNITGLVVLPIILVAFLLQHKLGILFLGITLLFGLFGLLSYTPGITSSTLSLILNDNRITFWCQPMFLIWVILHVVLSGRYYVGILTKKYWSDLRSAKVS